jgi:hypothetical protein
LEAIKKESLWKSAADTWTKYCKCVGLTRVHANRLIIAANVYGLIERAMNLDPEKIGLIPKSEWQIRPLTQDMSDEERVRSWNLAILIAKGNDPNDREVKTAVDQILGKEPKPSASKKRLFRQICG